MMPVNWKYGKNMMMMTAMAMMTMMMAMMTMAMMRMTMAMMAMMMGPGGGRGGAPTGGRHLGQLHLRSNFYLTGFFISLNRIFYIQP